MKPDEQESMHSGTDGYQHVPLPSAAPIAVRFEEATPLAPRAIKSCAEGYDGDEPLTPEEESHLHELQAHLTPERLDALVKQYPIPPEYWTEVYDYDDRN